MHEIRSVVKTAVSNFGVNINNFLCSIWKKCRGRGVMWSRGVVRSLCFPIMPLYLVLVKILLLLLPLSDQ